MNEVFRRRLIGLAVLLSLVFVLSLLLPQDDAATPAGDTPATTVSLDESLPPSPAIAAPAAPSPAPAPAPASAPAPPVREAASASIPAISALGDEPAATRKPEPAAPSPAAAAHHDNPAAALKLSPTVSAQAAKPDAAAKPKPAVTPPSPPPAAPAKPVVAAKPELSPPKPKLAESVAKAPAPSPPPAPVPAAAAAVGWYVQIGSFSDQGKAETIVSLLKNIGYKAESSTVVNSAGVTLNRVRLGPFPNEAAAQAAQVRVGKQGYPQARVTSEGKPAK